MRGGSVSSRVAIGATGLCLLTAAALAQQDELRDDAAQDITQIIVQADRLKQSPYRTGGDIQVVTRQEIEDRHYLNLTDAIRRIPGVQVSGPGYRAYEYGTTFGEEVSINGDSSVVVMINGRRVDNDANSYGQRNASKAKVPLDVITNINNIERIEVVKGTGSAAYGADATGGVINIITRRGGDDHETHFDLSAGSWGKRSYAVTQSGSFGNDNAFRYFASLNHQESDDTKYKDWVTGQTLTFANTRYIDQGSSLRLSRAFGQHHELNLQYSYVNGESHYPITAPDMATLHLLYEDSLPQGTVDGVPANQRPGYRNWFLYDAWLGSHMKPRSHDVELKYTFTDKDGAASYLRVYDNDRRNRQRLFAGLFGRQWSTITPEMWVAAQQSSGNFREETVRGYEGQFARTLGRHSVITGWDHRESEYEAYAYSSGLSSYVERTALRGYVQDKIRVTDRWQVTPGARYSTYGDIKRTATNGNVTERDGSSKVTFSAHAGFNSSAFGSFYASWAQIFRPKTNNDYTNEAPAIEVLHDEKGASWTLGFRKVVNQTAVEVNYALTDMENATARYSVWDENVVNNNSPTGFGNWVTRQVNATQKKEAVNVGLDHVISQTWAVRASYAYVQENFSAKNWRNNPDDVNVNALINRFRPKNTYRADATFVQGPWTVNGTAELFTDLERPYFTDRSFLVLRFALNYDMPGTFGGKGRLHLTVDNLTNEAWENRAHPVYGAGAYPQPGRSYMIGFSQSF